MSRPETHDDLLDHETAAHPFITLHDVGRLLDHPEVGAILLQIKAKAKSDGLIEETNYGTTVFSAPRTQKELDEALRTAQNQYDDAKRHYEAAVAGGDLTYAYQYNAYTSREGLGSGHEWIKAETARREALPLDAPEDEDDSFGVRIVAVETETTEESNA